MQFTIQTYIEDWLFKRRFEDTDDYAVRLASMYFRRRCDLNITEFLEKTGKINSLFFAYNGIENRRVFEYDLVSAVDRAYLSDIISLREFMDKAECAYKRVAEDVD